MNPRTACPLMKGPPKGPFASRVSATRHGVTGTKLRPEAPVVNVADTAVSEFIVTIQACIPEQAPLHPEKVVPDDGTAVSVTIVPLLKLAEQMAPQLMAPSLLVTVQVPLPCLVIRSAKVGTGVICKVTSAVLVC